MDLSVIIVNYNAKPFLDLCLQAIKRAIADISSEVFVVDNASTDGAPEMVAKKHPWVQLISNKENKGFSRANNQAIKIAKGAFIVIQNPDTIVAEDTYLKCLSFMKQTPLAGALGVKMLDGSGTFLQESKRGIPSPLTAFYKAFGFARLFPSHKHFSRYYLGHLPSGINCQAEVLAGAFMFVRKEVFEKAGLFDEAFFMFGEDIDLSFRFLKADYQNWYLAEAPIIHFKGESSKKSDAKYLNSFFGAMDIFYKKHFASKGPSPIQFFVRTGIWLKSKQFSRKFRQTKELSTPLPPIIYGISNHDKVLLTIQTLLQNRVISRTMEQLFSMPENNEKSTIVFTADTCTSTALNFMATHPTQFTYLFLSADNTFILGSSNSDTPGLVWEKKQDISQGMFDQ